MAFLSALATILRFYAKKILNIFISSQSRTFQTLSIRYNIFRKIKKEQKNIDMLKELW